MNEKIKPKHLERLAYIYLRQSDPKQVRNHAESRVLQLRLKERALELGWRESQIRVVGDLGVSGKSTVGREAYHEMLMGVLAGQVGLILCFQASRLGRNNARWQMLIEECLYADVLLGDDRALYDPTDRHDFAMLGIQGVMAEYELKSQRHVMQESWWQVARRGEMYPNMPPGYVVTPFGMEKHSHRRVQNVVDFVLHEVQKFPSVRQYVPWLVRHGYELPGSYLHGEPPDRVTWVKPTYSRVLGMLKNPRYTGTYVLGESKTVWERTEEGPRAKRVLVPQSEWDIVIPNHHEAYLTVEEYEKNLAKLASNAAQYGGKVKGSPQKGESLLVGLLRCRRCGGKLKVNYSSKSSPRFRCTAGSRERDGSTKGCFSFAARRPEERFEEALLHVVRPAGLEAAVEAEKRFHKEYESRRQLLLDRLDDLRLRAHDASDRYHQADPRNTLVIPNLEKKWNDALQAVKEHEARLEQFETKHRHLPTPEQRLELERLGEDLDRVWFRPQTDMVLKKQIVHLLVQEVLVDIDEEQNEIVLTIHWRGGHHTQLREPRRQHKRRSDPADLIAVIDNLRKLLEDDLLATTLNRSRIPTEKGESWTARRVRAFRKKHQLPSFDPLQKKDQGWLSQEEAATRLGVSPMSVSRLVNWEILPALQAKPGLPAIILEANLGLKAVEKAVKTIQANRFSPLPENPDQLSLFGTTNS